MGRNQQSVSIGHDEEQQGNKQRDHDRQQRNIGQDERRVILRNGAGPVDEGAGLDPAMVAGIQISSGVEVKAAAGRLLEIGKTGHTHKAGRQPDGNQETGK